MITYPVRLTYDYQIVDNQNKVVLPELTWRNDALHLAQQKEIGELIVALMNANEVARQFSAGKEQIYGRSLADVVKASQPAGTADLSEDRPGKVSRAGGRKK